MHKYVTSFFHVFANKSYFDKISIIESSQIAFMRGEF